MKYVKWANTKWQHCWEYRNGPVPGTGHCGGYWRVLRSPGTFPERKEALFISLDEDLKGLRIKHRHYSELPTNWDDYHRSDWNTKSWKKNRKHQWRE